MFTRRTVQLVGILAMGLSLVASRLRAEEKPGDVKFESEIEFAKPQGEPLLLNLAQPKTRAETSRPAIVCIHGGGFTGGTRNDWNRFARRLAENGYVAITIDYRLAPKFKWPAHVHDCRTAIRWLRANSKRLNIDPNRIGAMGNSAGAHLAQFLAVTNEVREFDGDGEYLDQSGNVNAIAAWGQASDFTREYGVWKQAPEVFRGFLGSELTVDSRRIHIKASPLFWVTPNAAPSMIIHGTEDKDVLFAQSVWMYERLKSAEVDTELVPIIGGGHGLVGAHLEAAELATIRFFARVLKPLP